MKPVIVDGDQLHWSKGPNYVLFEGMTLVVRTARLTARIA